MYIYIYVYIYIHIRFRAFSSNMFLLSRGGLCNYMSWKVKESSRLAKPRRDVIHLLNARKVCNPEHAETPAHPSSNLGRLHGVFTQTRTLRVQGPKKKVLEPKYYNINGSWALSRIIWVLRPLQGGLYATAVEVCEK